MFLTIAIRIPYVRAECLLDKKIDPFSREEFSFGIPGKEDRDRELNRLTMGRWHIQPLRLIGAGDECLFEHTLRPDHNVLQVEMNIREGAQ